MPISIDAKFRRNQLEEYGTCVNGASDYRGIVFSSSMNYFSTNFVGDMTSKQNRRSESFTGLTVHIRRSSSITVGTSPSPRFLKKE